MANKFESENKTEHMITCKNVLIVGLHQSWKNGRCITGEWSFYVYLESSRFEIEEIHLCEIVDAT